MLCSGSCANDTGQTAFYIESRCYVKYDEEMSWFSARNNCLTNNGDLASFTQLSLLSGKIDSDGVWVGLRNNQWKWQNAGRHFILDVLWKGSTYICKMKLHDHWTIDKCYIEECMHLHTSRPILMTLEVIREQFIM